MQIAARKLKVRMSDRDVDMEVRLFAPVKEDTAWTCPYEIDWPTGAKSSSAAGLDAIQAIFLAFQKIGIELYVSSYHQNGELLFDFPGRGYGFPVPYNARDLLVGDDLTL